MKQSDSPRNLLRSTCVSAQFMPLLSGLSAGTVTVRKVLPSFADSLPYLPRLHFAFARPLNSGIAGGSASSAATDNANTPAAAQAASLNVRVKSRLNRMT